MRKQKASLTRRQRGAILDALEDDTVLSFNADEICLREEGGHVLYKSLKSKTTMHNLLHAALPKQKLGWNVIGELSKLFLAECVCLRSLDISYCFLLPDERATVQNAKALEQLIVRRESLLALDISGNNLLVPGASARVNTADAESMGMDWFLNCVSTNTHLEVLRMVEVRLTQPIRLALGKALLKNTKGKLASFVGEKLSISRRDVELVIATPVDNEQILNSDDCVLLCGILASHPSVMSLTLRNQSVGKDGAGALAHLLWRNKKLRVLDLEGSFLGDAGFRKLMRGLLRSGEEYTDAFGDAHGIISLNIASTRVTEYSLGEFGVCLLQLMQNNRTEHNAKRLKYIETNSLRISPKDSSFTLKASHRSTDVVLLLALLCNNISITSLKFNGWSCESNVREPEIVRALSVMLSRNSSIKMLDLSSSFLDSSYSSQVIQALAASDTQRIRTLCLGKHVEESSWKRALEGNLGNVLPLEFDARISFLFVLKSWARTTGVDCLSPYLLPTDMIKLIFELAADSRTVQVYDSDKHAEKRVSKE